MKKIRSVTPICLMLIFGVLTCNACSTASSDVITVITREDGSGTRNAFMGAVGVKSIIPNAEVSQSTTVVMTSVMGDPNAIGYISFGSLNESVKALRINGIAANTETIQNGSYGITRPFNVVIKEVPSEVVSDFIAYIMSAEGQEVVKRSGYGGIGSGERYAARDVGGKIVITGSSSVKPVMEKLAEAYIKHNPHVNIELMQSDSANGIRSVSDGLCDIGMVSREIGKSELGKKLTVCSIAIDGIVVIVNKNCPVSDLTLEQLAAIYSGKIAAWSALSTPAKQENGHE